MVWREVWTDACTRFSQLPLACLCSFPSPNPRPTLPLTHQAQAPHPQLSSQHTVPQALATPSPHFPSLHLHSAPRAPAPRLPFPSLSPYVTPLSPSALLRPPPTHGLPLALPLTHQAWVPQPQLSSQHSVIPVPATPSPHFPSPPLPSPSLPPRQLSLPSSPMPPLPSHQAWALHSQLSGQHTVAPVPLPTSPPLTPLPFPPQPPHTAPAPLSPGMGSPFTAVRSAYSRSSACDPHLLSTS